MVCWPPRHPNSLGSIHPYSGSSQSDRKWTSCVIITRFFSYRNPSIMKPRYRMEGRKRARDATWWAMRNYV